MAACWVSTSTARPALAANPYQSRRRARATLFAGGQPTWLARPGRTLLALPDAVFQATLQEVRAWIAREYGGLDLQFEEQNRFAIDVARFKS